MFGELAKGHVRERVDSAVDSAIEGNGKTALSARSTDSPKKFQRNQKRLE
jgi:hypothetical protein